MRPLSFFLPIDPKSNTPSVSLGLVVVSTGLVITVCIFEILGHDVKNDMISQFFYSSLALYFGRRINFLTSSDSPEKMKNLDQEKQNSTKIGI